MAAAAILKNLIIAISAAFGPILTKFGKMMQFDSLDRPDSYKFEIFKIQDGGGRHLEKLKNRDISAAFGPISTKFGMVTYSSTLLTVPTVKTLKFQKSKMAAAAILKN